MKKILLAVALFLALNTACYAYDVSAERAINLMVAAVTPSQTVTNVRTSVTTNDATTAVSGILTTPVLGTGINTIGYRGILMNVQSWKMSTATITPLFGTTTRYYEDTADARTVTLSSDAYVVYTYGCPDVNFKVSSMTCQPGLASAATGVTIDARLVS